MRKSRSCLSDFLPSQVAEQHSNLAESLLVSMCHLFFPFHFQKQHLKYFSYIQNSCCNFSHTWLCAFFPSPNKLRAKLNTVTLIS